MTETPAPTAAVAIVAEVLARNAASVYEMDREIVDKLARAGWLHDPAELDAARARVAALESVVDTVVRAAAVDGDTAGVTTRVAIRQMRDTRAAFAARDAETTSERP